MTVCKHTYGRKGKRSPVRDLQGASGLLRPANFGDLQTLRASNKMSAPMLPSNSGDVGMEEEEDEVQIVEEGARQQVGPHGMRTPGENLRILLAQRRARPAGGGGWSPCWCRSKAMSTQSAT